MTPEDGIAKTGGLTVSPEQLAAKEAAAIDLRVKQARTSILNSLIDLGVVARCDALTAFTTDKKYEVAIGMGRTEASMEYTRWDRDHSRIDSATLPWPLNMEDSSLLVGYCIRRGELTFGWTEDKMEKRVSMILGDDARTALVRIDKHPTGKPTGTAGESHSFYRGGRLIREEYVEKDVKLSTPSEFRPSGFWALLASSEPAREIFHREIVHEETTITPTVAEFGQTEEWKDINALETSLRVAAYKPKPEGGTPRGHHISRPHRHAA